MALRLASEVDGLGDIQKRRQDPCDSGRRGLKCGINPIEGQKPSWLEMTVFGNGRGRTQAIQTLLEHPVFSLNQAPLLNGSEPGSPIFPKRQLSFNLCFKVPRSIHGNPQRARQIPSAHWVWKFCLHLPTPTVSALLMVRKQRSGPLSLECPLHVCFLLKFICYSIIIH